MWTSKENKRFKGKPKKFDLCENSNVNVATYPKVENVFFNTIQPLSLNNIKSWSVTFPRTVESLQKNKFDVNNDINSKVSSWQRDITKINLDVLVNATSETVISEGGINGAIHDAEGSELLHECQNLNACETADCKVTYVFHIVWPRDKNDILHFAI